MRDVAQKYQIIQLGVCLFISSPREASEAKTNEKKYMAYPYNVYLFPEERSGPRSDVVLDIDTVNFHKQQKLDFNKWIYEGVSYISASKEKHLGDKLMAERTDTIENLQINENDAKIGDEEIEKVKKWIEDGGKGEFVITKLNAFLRKYLYMQLNKKFPQVYHATKVIDRSKKDVVLTLVTEEERKALDKAKRDAKLKELGTKSGALRLLKLLVSLKVPIIGHNPIFDLMFIYSHFCNELPRTWAEFKREIHGLFPTIYDTMLIFGNEKLKKLQPEKQSSGLEAMYMFVSKSAELPKIDINMEQENRYSIEQRYHEAGYDSYITGYSFIKLAEYIGKEDLAKYTNQLYVHRASYNYNLDGKDLLHDSVSIKILM